MAVTKFGKIYYADYHDAAGVRRRISLQTQNKLVAQQKFKERLRRRAAIKERIVIHISWDNFKEKLYHYMKMEKNRNTISRTRLAIKHLEDVHKPRFLQDVTPEFVQKVKESMIQKGFKNANINRLVGSLKTAMHLGEKWQLVPKQNWAVIPKLKVPRGRVVFHTPEEIDKILAACPNEKKDYLTGNYPLIAKSVGISSFFA